MAQYAAKSLAVNTG